MQHIVEPIVRVGVIGCPAQFPYIRPSCARIHLCVGQQRPKLYLFNDNLLLGAIQFLHPHIANGFGLEQTRVRIAGHVANGGQKAATANPRFGQLQAGIIRVEAQADLAGGGCAPHAGRAKVAHGHALLFVHFFDKHFSVYGRTKSTAQIGIAKNGAFKVISQIKNSLFGNQHQFKVVLAAQHLLVGQRDAGDI